MLCRRCHCGRPARQHVDSDARPCGGSLDEERETQQEWLVGRDTVEQPTDAYGVLNFQGASHTYRAKVAECSADTLAVPR